MFVSKNEGILTETYQKAYADDTPRPRATERSSQSLFLSLPVMGTIGIIIDLIYCVVVVRCPKRNKAGRGNLLNSASSEGIITVSAFSSCYTHCILHDCAPSLRHTCRISVHAFIVPSYSQTPKNDQVHTQDSITS